MYSFLQQLNFSSETKILENEPLAPKTTLQVGGCARWYAEPSTVEDLRLLLIAANENKIPLFIMGRGSNLIVLDEGFPGLVLRLSHPYWKQLNILDEHCMQVMAGVRLKEITGKASTLGWAGFEFMEGIPGSLGGALKMNAGAMGSCMFDRVESLECMSIEGHLLNLEKKDFNVGYRHCYNLDKAIVLSAILKKKNQSDPESVRTIVDDYSKKRKTSQPREASAGCAFKNPQGHSAGQLVDQAGIKGMHVGKVQVSCIHGNFLVNQGGAKAQEVIELITYIRKKILQERGIILDPEVVVVGKNWNQILESYGS